MAKKIVMVLDTETIGGVKGKQEVVDLGFIVAEIDTKTYKTRILDSYNGLVTETLYDLLDGKISEEDATFWTEERLRVYHRMQFNSRVKVKPVNYHKVVLNNAIAKYNPIVCAYNLPFDTKAILNTLRIDLKANAHIDIWGFAVQTLGQQKTYRKTLTQRKMFSASGKFFSSNAETMYRYINLDWKHVEAHTALSDAKEELEILVKCMRQKKKVVHNINNPFQRVRL